MSVKVQHIWRDLSLILLLTALLTVPGILWHSQQESQVRASYRSPMAPVFLIPGSSATQNRFNELVSVLNRQNKTQHSLLRVEVRTNGALRTSGSIRSGDRHPFIVVGFQNNKDGLNNIRQQGKWFALAFKKLQTTYHFNHFSAMGHSNGGLILTLFLENDLATTGAHAERLMTIASPFNLEEWDANVNTPMFNELVAGRNRLPKNLVVYSLAGTETYNGDGIVPYDSVNRGKYIFQKQVRHYTQITVTGADAKHATLPENQQIVKMIRQYLLN